MTDKNASVEGTMDDVFKTKDLSLMAALRVFGFKLDEVQRVGNTVYGYYKSTPDLEEIVNDFELGNLRVEPVAFHSALRSVRKTMSPYENSN